MTEPGTFRASDRSPVDFKDALPLWEQAARPALERTARTYRATISYKELAEEVQEQSGVRTLMLPWHWIGRVLGAVAHDCHGNGEPMLSALCVRSDGTVGDGYAKAIVETVGGPPPEDLDMHAATERFRCYQYFGAQMPPDGGSPALTKQVAAKRSWVRRQTANAAMPSRPICPTCHLMLPMSGQCDNCE